MTCIGTPLPQRNILYHGCINYHTKLGHMIASVHSSSCAYCIKELLLIYMYIYIPIMDLNELYNNTIL